MMDPSGAFTPPQIAAMLNSVRSKLWDMALDLSIIDYSVDPPVVRKVENPERFETMTPEEIYNELLRQAENG